MKPNILFISCDQQRWDCLGFNHRYPVQTPNLDRLAAEGMRFNNSYTPLPVCCPAREALICGKRPERIGALCNYDNVPLRLISKDEFSWARELAADGYRTGYVGKWHVSPELTPLDFGYEDYVPVSVLTGHQAQKYPDRSYRQAEFPEVFFGEPSPYPLEDSPTHQNAAHVMRLIDTYGDAPWHIKMDFPEPHLPCRPAEPFASMYESVPKWHSFDDSLEGKPYIQKQMRWNWKTRDLTWEEAEKCVRLYYGYISQIDDAIGRVLRHLEEIGQLDNTVIIYTADHGDMCCDRKMMDKHYIMYDEVVRVPLVIRYPRMIAPNSQSDAFVTNMLDLVPTILDFAGLPHPADTDGISLMPYLTGAQTESIRKYAMSTYNGQQFGLYVQRMLRSNDYKYIWNLTDTDELYDLKKDPHELHNCIHDPAYAEILQVLRRDLLNELDAVQDFAARGNWVRDQLRCGNKY